MLQSLLPEFIHSRDARGPKKSATWGAGRRSHGYARISGCDGPAAIRRRRPQRHHAGAYLQAPLNGWLSGAMVSSLQAGGSTAADVTTMFYNRQHYSSDTHKLSNTPPYRGECKENGADLHLPR